MTRPEQHLFLHLQRFSYCLDRYRARFDQAGPEPQPVADRAQRIGRITDDIAALDTFIASAYPEPSLPLLRLAAALGLDRASLHLLVAAAAPALDLSLARRIGELCGRAQPQAGFLVDVLAATV